MPGWRGFESDALASRADAAGATEAEDPVALVASKIAEEGVDAGFEALTSLGEEAHSWGEHLRAFSLVADAALASGATETLAERAETTLRAHVAATRIPPPAYPDPPAQEAPAELEPDEEERVAALEAAAAEVESIVEPEPLGEEPTEEERVAWEEANAAWEDARPIKDAADGARDAALARAEIREKAARALTRKLPPLFARRNAALAARPIVEANAPWHAAVRTALGRAAHEAVASRWTPPTPPPDTEKPPEASETNGDDSDARPSSAPPPPPPALEAVVELTRGVEIAARCGDVGRLSDARSRAVRRGRRSSGGADAENGRLAKHGGARCLHVAGARVVEHLARLATASPTRACWRTSRGESPSPVVAAAAADDAVARERRAYLYDPDDDAKRAPEPWHAAHPDADVAFLTRFVVSAADACAVAGAHHRAASLYLDAVDLAESDAFAIEILPRAAKGARAAGARRRPRRVTRRRRIFVARSPRGRRTSSPSRTRDDSRRLTRRSPKRARGSPRRLRSRNRRVTATPPRRRSWSSATRARPSATSRAL